MSITNLTTDEIVARVLQYIVDQLALCGFSTCTVKRWHGEPDRLYCCDCDNGGYAVLAWVDSRFPGDGSLAKARNFVCPLLDVLDIHFTVARCWPQVTADPMTNDPRDAVAVELQQVLDCLVDAFETCSNQPNLFDQVCSRLAVEDWRAKRICWTDGTYNDEPITFCCAGWTGSILVA